MRTRPTSTRNRQRGVGLLDALIALAILAFGMLALTGFQSKLVAQATEGQHRMQASQLADELLNTALVDSTANTWCYTLPATGACGSAAAQAYTLAWKARVQATLPGAVAPTVTWNGAGTPMTAVLQWTWTTKDGSTPAETRTHTVISDPT